MFAEIRNPESERHRVPQGIVFVMLVMKNLKLKIILGFLGKLFCS